MTVDKRAQQPDATQGRTDKPSLSDMSCYLLPSGLIARCASCGRLRRNDGSLIWDQVASELTSELQNLTDTICPECQVVLYPGLLI